MTVITKQIETVALASPPAERALLAEKLLASLEPENQPTLDRLWAEEAENRIQAYESGELSAADAEDVFARMERRLAR